jgi:UDP-N-acetyl-D-galactosamine dehydrogenase
MDDSEPAAAGGNDTSAETVAVIGLGYVGLPVALAFARRFPGTIGFDIDAVRVEELSRGVDRTGEFAAEEIVAAGLRVTGDASELGAASFFIVAVPTPLGEGRTPDLSAVLAAADLVGGYLSEGAMVVLESTVWPGVTEEVFGPRLASASGLELGVDFVVGYSPERINPGDKVHTFERVPKVIAAADPVAMGRMEALYGAVTPSVVGTPSIRAAELAKLLENTQRDLNIALMNELALICDRLGVPTQDVLAVARTKWNFLDFEPGLVGGHCISVDPYYLTAKAQALGLHPEVILAGRRINDQMGRFVAQKTLKLLAEGGGRVSGARIGVLGLTFKEDFPDVRNSLAADIVAELKAFGAEVLADDPYVAPAVIAERYGAEPCALEAMYGLDALVVAVKHRCYRDEQHGLARRVRAGGVLVDVKSIVRAPEAVPPEVRYWSL